MSQDIQLSSMNSMPPQGDYFPSGGGSGGPAPAANPLKQLHKLRDRVKALEKAPENKT